MKGNKHAYYLPTDEDGDGRLDHLTVYISGGLTDKVCEALANTHTLKVREGAEIRLLLLGFSRAGDRGSGVYFGSSAVWRSATLSYYLDIPNVTEAAQSNSMKTATRSMGPRPRF